MSILVRCILGPWSCWEKWRITAADNQVKIGSTPLTVSERKSYHSTIIESQTSVWKPQNISEIDPKVKNHRLKLNPDYKSIKRKKWNHRLKQQIATAEEIDKLLKAGAIQEVYYPKWIANTFIVWKRNDTDGCVWILQIYIQLVQNTTIPYPR